MPANLTPEYRAAEAAFRKARDPRERLEALREMLRVMPKHKGTDHLQGDIKRRIKELSEELERSKSGGGAHGGPPLVIRPEGAAQVALLGPPNVGKSSLHARLTGSGAPVAPYPFTTQFPQPGMLPHEGIHFQLVDLPPISTDHPVPWIANALQTADACLLVVDLGDPECLDQVEAMRAILRERRVRLTGAPDALPSGENAEGDDDDPFIVRLPALVLANKADRLADPESEVRTFLQLGGFSSPTLAVSAITGRGLERIGPWLFDYLGIVRVYAKMPGRPPDRDRPFTLRKGHTIEDVARLVHKDVVAGLKYARVWGRAGFDGQHVGRDHPVADGDVVELHS